jgi:hypothetical protein
MHNKGTLERMTHMKNIILTDVDGVLLNWIDAFHAWMEARGYKCLRDDVYDISVRFGIKTSEEMLLIKSFNESAHIGFLPPLRDALHYVRKLHEEHGYVFRAITSLSKNPYAAKLREQNLSKLFGTAMDTVVCLDVSAPKDAALQPYEGSGMWWIEDKISNAVTGQRLGLKSILMIHEHNHTDTEVIHRAHSWKQIYEIITSPADFRHDLLIA